MRIIDVEKKGEGWNIEYSTIGSEISTAFIIILKV
jgi:hypothetical protein